MGTESGEGDVGTAQHCHGPGKQKRTTVSPGERRDFGWIANYRWTVPTDSDDWTPDAADWLSEGVQAGSVQSGGSGTDDTALAGGSPGVASGSGTVSGGRPPGVFDDPLNEAVPPTATSPKPARTASVPPSAAASPDVSASAKPAKRPPGKGRASRRARGAHQASRRPRKRQRMRILPRSVLGISLLILAAGLGAAVSGTVLFMRYEYRRDVSDANIKGFDKRVKLSTDAVIAEGQNAQARIQNELEPLLKQAATGDTLIRILNQTKASIMTVQTFSEAGVPVVGTAFVAASDAEKSFLITSYSVVKASVVRPGPAITVRIDGTDRPATLWTWQEDRDLALLIVNKGGLLKLDWADPKDTRLGSQVFAVSALGTDGGAVTSGFVADVSSSGIQHYAPIGTAFQGGPIVNDRGRVVAVGSQNYAPLGFTSTGVWFAPAIRSACEQLLKCPSGLVTGAGTRR